MDLLDVMLGCPDDQLTEGGFDPMRLPLEQFTLQRPSLLSRQKRR